jgi:hypothetical protein
MFKKKFSNNLLLHKASKSFKKFTTSLRFLSSNEATSFLTKHAFNPQTIKSIKLISITIMKVLNKKLGIKK